MLICDTSGLVAFFDASDQHHQRVAAAVDSDPGPFVVSPYVLAELDHLLVTRRGVTAELAALAELAGGGWDLPAMDATDIGAAHSLIDRYRDQNIGLADASIAVLAHSYRTTRVLTLDHRHFEVLRTAAGRRLTLVPGRN